MMYAVNIAIVTDLGPLSDQHPPEENGQDDPEVEIVIQESAIAMKIVIEIVKDSTENATGNEIGTVKGNEIETALAIAIIDDIEEFSVRFYSWFFALTLPHYKLLLQPFSAFCFSFFIESIKVVELF